MLATDDCPQDCVVKPQLRFSDLKAGVDLLNALWLQKLFAKRLLKMSPTRLISMQTIFKEFGEKSVLQSHFFFIFAKTATAAKVSFKSISLSFLKRL